MVGYLTKKTRCNSFLLKCFSISVICFNVICRIDNGIVFSDLVLPLWATVKLFPLSSVQGSVPRCSVLPRDLFGPLQKRCVCELMLAGVERLPFSSWTLWWSCLALCLINWMSPVDSDDPWQGWTFTSSGQHGLSSLSCFDILPAFGVFVFVFNFIYLLLLLFLAASDLACSRQSLCCIMQDLFLSCVLSTQAQ